MIGVIVIVYTITYYLPGAPPIPAVKAAALGLNKPYPVQLGAYIWKLISKLDLGKSYLTNIPVTMELAIRIPITFKLSMLCIFLMLAVGLPCGMISALRQYSALDVSLTSLSLITSAIPGFILALISAVFFGVTLKWLPVTGLDSWKSWIQPVFCSAMSGVAIYIRMTRTAMLEVIRQDYIRSAKAKGMRDITVVRKHALRNCMIPLATVTGISVAAVLSGSIIVETIFSIPGMGLYLMDGILSRDYPVINGSVVVISLLVCFVNLFVDVIYAFIDPRVRTQFISPTKIPKI
jgi:peptide/nickel transport system permease protein